MNRLKTKLEELFGIDLRSLALLRIGLALLLIADLINRATHLSAHYTDSGVLPRVALIEEFSNASKFSIHFFAGKYGFQVLLFIIAGFFALGLLVGYRTRLMTVVSWFFLVSLHTRNPLVLQGGDILFRMLLFWAMFLPLGACYSADSALNTNPQPKPARVLSAGSFALLLQIAFVYWFTVALKTGKTWWEEGTAVYYALSIDQLTSRFGHFLLGFPKLLKSLTYSTLLLEALGPALAFCPIFTGPIRTAVVFLFIFLHLGFGLSMELGLFSYISMVGWLPFLPTWFWEAVFRRLRTPERLGWPLVPFFRLQPVYRIGERICWWVARHRQRSAQLERVLRFGPISYRSHWVVESIAAIFLVYVFLWNLRTVYPTVVESFLPQNMNWIGQMLRLDQKWDMFAANPDRNDGWYVIPGKLKNGHEVDLFKSSTQVDWSKPADVAHTYPNQRWRKYMMNLRKKDSRKHRQSFARWLCREWNNRHLGNEKLESLEIYFVLEKTLPNYQASVPKRILLRTEYCFGKSKEVPEGQRPLHKTLPEPQKRFRK
jgi:hypothetical protein